MITFLQADDDRALIYALADVDGQATARFEEPATPAGHLHRLDDFFGFYDYPSDVVTFVEATRKGIAELGTPGGRSVSAWPRGWASIRTAWPRRPNRESVVDGLYDSEENPVFLDRSRTTGRRATSVACTSTRTRTGSRPGSRSNSARDRGVLVS
jgi:hypothetical protein